MDHDNPQLADALAFVGRPISQVTPKAQLIEGHWAGMPAYQQGGELPKLTIRFETPEDRELFVRHFGFRVKRSTPKQWSMRWPDMEDADSASVRFAERRP